MCENDIYNSKAKYEKFKNNLDLLLLRPEERKRDNGGKLKYYCKNNKNLEYFKKLFIYFEAKDLSYIRRNRTIDCMKLICYVIEKDLKDCDRDDINQLIAYMHSVCKSPESKTDFIKNVKRNWRVLFPEKDERERIDETITPYAVRHLSTKIDKSKQKLRNDRLTWEEFEKVMNYFNSDVRIQSYLFLSLESLGRPQEILYTKIKDIELYDNYAKVYISEHGKEGTGFLQCIDSYPYVSKWFNQHPLKTNQESYFFINRGRNKQYEQLKPNNINIILKNACKKLDIKKSITCYSLKRNGVTFRRLRGDSDVEIQHAARWTSTKQLKVYDMSNQEDAFKMELVKRGIINNNDPNLKNVKPKIKTCIFCQKNNGLTNEVCDNCHRPLDREKIKNLEKTRESDNLELKKELELLKEQYKEVESIKHLLELDEVKNLLRIFSKLEKEVKSIE